MTSYFKRLSNGNSICLENQRFAKEEYLNENFTLRFVFSGYGCFKINGRSLMVFPDSFLSINKNTSYQSSISSSEHVQSLSISFASAFINDSLSTITRSTSFLLDNFSSHHTADPYFPESLLPVKRNLMFNLKHINRFILAKVNDDSLLEEYLCHTFINYTEIVYKDLLLKQDHLNCSRRNTKKELIRRLGIAKDFIYCNYNQSITLSQIAAISCLSVNHLLRTFKQAFGETPHQFLTKIRLIRANELLKNSLFPLNEVVAMVGFECSSSFIRLYKSYFGQTPGNFRLTQ